MPFNRPFNVLQIRHSQRPEDLATGIRKWSRHLSDFPTPKFTTPDCIQQWLSILTDIYTYLCVTDTAFKSALLDMGPHPFTLQCLSPWGSVPSDPDTCPHADLVNDVLINVRVLACSDRLAANRWLSVHQHSRSRTRYARRSMAEPLLGHGQEALFSLGASNLETAADQHRPSIVFRSASAD